jgi:hypothetical protein
MENIFYYMTGFAYELKCEDVIVVCTAPTIAIKPRIVRKVRFVPRNALPING